MSLPVVDDDLVGGDAVGLARPVAVAPRRRRLLRRHLGEPGRVRPAAGCVRVPWARAGGARVATHDDEKKGRSNFLQLRCRHYCLQQHQKMVFFHILVVGFTFLLLPSRRPKRAANAVTAQNQYKMGRRRESRAPPPPPPREKGKPCSFLNFEKKFLFKPPLGAVKSQSLSCFPQISFFLLPLLSSLLLLPPHSKDTGEEGGKGRTAAEKEGRRRKNHTSHLSNILHT